MRKFTCIFTDGFREDFGKVFVAGEEESAEGAEPGVEKVVFEPTVVIGAIKKGAVECGNKALERLAGLNPKDKIAWNWEEKTEASSAFQSRQKVEVTAKTLNLRNIHTGEVERKLQKDTKDTVMISNAVPPIKVNGITFVNVNVNGGEYYVAEKYLKPAKLEGQYMITSNLKYDKSGALTVDGEPLPHSKKVYLNEQETEESYLFRQKHIKQFGQRVLLPALVERTGNANLRYQDIFGENSLYPNFDTDLKFLADGVRMEFRKNKLDFKLVAPNGSFAPFRVNPLHQTVAAYTAKKEKEASA